MGWRGPILTDSGGYQVFSLAKLRTIDEDGVHFQSHLDGSRHASRPSASMEIQAEPGRGHHHGLRRVPARAGAAAAVAEATERTHALGPAQPRARTRAPDQALFGIVQGGVHLDLREQSAREIAAIGFPGYAIGGLSRGRAQAGHDARARRASIPCCPRTSPAT